MREYIPQIRLHDPAYLVRHAVELKNIAFAHSYSSYLIYACLELRTTLELIEFELLLASIGEEFHEEYAELMKKKNGIDQANKKLKTLKEKFQYYYQAICEIANINGKFFDYKKSKDLQFELSQYIHTYWRRQSEIDFNSSFMQNAFVVIEEVIKFIDTSIRVGDEYHIQSMEYKISNNERELFDKWIGNANMKYEDLVKELRLILVKE